jgi:hypothetical protein
MPKKLSKMIGGEGEEVIIIPPIKINITSIDYSKATDEDKQDFQNQKNEDDFEYETEGYMFLDINYIDDEGHEVGALINKMKIKNFNNIWYCQIWNQYYKVEVTNYNKKFILTLIDKKSLNVLGGRTVKSARVTPVKTSRTYKGKDGVTRVLYKRGLDFYVKKKSEKTGKFTYRKVKV